MKIVANIQPFVIPQSFQVVNENSGVVEAEFFTTLDSIQEDIAAQIDKYNIKDIYLHGEQGYLTKMKQDIERNSINKYNNAVGVYII